MNPDFEFGEAGEAFVRAGWNANDLEGVHGAYRDTAAFLSQRAGSTTGRTTPGGLRQASLVPLSKYLFSLDRSARETGLHACACDRPQASPNAPLPFRWARSAYAGARNSNRR